MGFWLVPVEHVVPEQLQESLEQDELEFIGPELLLELELLELELFEL
jgi:hypothetical protein